MVASLLGEPARANILTALMDGRALTASELAQAAGVTAQTASSHLGKLHAGGLIEQRKQGRHRYFQLSGPDVAQVLEGLMGLAARSGHMRRRTGPKDPALRFARVCYDHLAGEMGVRLFDSMCQRGLVSGDDPMVLTPAGHAFVAEFGVATEPLTGSRRPLCKACLDWSARRAHMAGAVGAALFDRMQALDWARREAGSRVVVFTPAGEMSFKAQFPIAETK